ncbi:MAG: ATP synthase F1 subunit delta [Clostridia bacterium]|nr:ATP synthase F1 subunit delta [Clostridia bacterium]
MNQFAKIYGDSLYDLALEEKLADVILNQMEDINTIFSENPDYIRLLSEASIKKDERIGLIEKSFGEEAERYLVNFIKILCEKNKLDEFGGCLKEFRTRYNKDNNISEAFLTSAVKLSDEQLALLKEKLEKAHNKTIILHEKIDPGIIAGLKLELDGVEMDGTVLSRLNGISKKLNETII